MEANSLCREHGVHVIGCVGGVCMLGRVNAVSMVGCVDVNMSSMKSKHSEICTNSDDVC